MSKSVFKPTVILFGLTNSPATFQVIMNNLLRDIIKAENIAAFINNIIVGTETEEGYDDIVEEVLRRMAENNLFVKLENMYEGLERLDF